MEKSQVEKASKALLKHLKSKKSEETTTRSLLPEEESIYIMITTKTISPKSTPKPHKIPIPHSYHDEEETEVCLITKDPQREFKDKVSAEGVKAVKKVIGVSKLKAKFKQFEAKRVLCNSYDLFLADDRVTPMLPSILGKTFFERKKLPVPVALGKAKKIGNEIKSAMSCTVFYKTTGTCNSVKIGKASQSSNEIVENIMAAMPKIVDKIPKGWDNIQSVYLKSKNSIALPLFMCLPSASPVEETEKVVEEEEVEGKKRKLTDEPKTTKSKSKRSKTKIAAEDMIDIYADKDERLLEKLSKRIGMKLTAASK